MQIILNGQNHPLENQISVSDLLLSLGLSGKPVVVELNLEPVLPRSFETTSVSANDRLEIITLAAGG
jgi:sulfur carrier protein